MHMLPLFATCKHHDHRYVAVQQLIREGVMCESDKVFLIFDEARMSA
jgi:hypothetical protein